MKHRYYTGIIGKEMNDGKHVFVFGSNLGGRHGKGAAREAAKYWGALPFVGRGLQGKSYALPTKDEWLEPLDLFEIEADVDLFLLEARCNPALTFLVTPIGTGLAGYTHADIAPMFDDAPDNCVLPEAWIPYLEKKDAKRR